MRENETAIPKLIPKHIPRHSAKVKNMWCHYPRNQKKKKQVAKVKGHIACPSCFLEAPSQGVGKTFLRLLTAIYSNFHQEKVPEKNNDPLYTE